MGGPREAVWHALIRKNYGCTHFIVGRDHAGPGNKPDGNPFYEPYEAQELYQKYHDEMDITMVPFQMMVYVDDKAQYIPVNETTKDMQVSNISGTEFAEGSGKVWKSRNGFLMGRLLRNCEKFILQKHQQGFTLFFTGLSGSGKSTIANALLVKMLENGNRRVTNFRW